LSGATFSREHPARRSEPRQLAISLQNIDPAILSK
jgi:hypothetical protein